jgi:hypothetical protein
MVSTTSTRGGILRAKKPPTTNRVRQKEINLSTALAGQAVGIKEVEDGIWLVSFMDYDLGFIDLEEKTLQPLNNPFGPRM